ncbi:hypothetical protein [Frankia gtarii]|uniref:hypothetical protein n=1 Tax=Frankia gtarii TaxID=2950102 RepID=UPI0021BF3A44|nr:hypothetical protein [Frankia gtarii]
MPSRDQARRRRSPDPGISASRHLGISASRVAVSLVAVSLVAVTPGIAQLASALGLRLSLTPDTETT